jgi:CheY-like chemotaxis protein
MILESDPPDLLISDIGMPGEDGYRLIQRVRALGNDRAQTPAIALTAYARLDDRVKAVESGYQMHLAKPVEPTELIAMAASWKRHAEATVAKVPPQV